MGKEEKEANAKKETTEEIAADAQRDLDEALPALDQAVASLKSLKVSDITELKAFKNPPAGVKMVMEGVCIMKGVKPKMVNGDKPGEKVTIHRNFESRCVDSLLCSVVQTCDAARVLDNARLYCTFLRFPYVDFP